ncbi:MAG: family 16 glycoside hydrolase, partial [Verrucomicrobiota bacterium]|nr:family 16 glycoside hydrolase [Verrucomicrobiota bacterium]
MKLFSLTFIFSATLVIAFSLATLADEKKKSEFLEDDKNEKWIQLFNGKDLTGWTPKIRYENLGEDKRNTFLVADGVIKVNYEKYDEFNKTFGHLFYKTLYSSYRLRVEYRFLGEQLKGGPGWAY